MKLKWIPELKFSFCHLYIQELSKNLDLALKAITHMS